MKKALLCVVIMALVVQFGYMTPYNAPFDQIQMVQTYQAIDGTSDSATIYRGDADYLTRVNNYNFTDVNGIDKLDAIKLATHGITEGIGNKQFGPSQKIKNIEVLTMLVRLYGNNDAVIKRVTENFGEAPSAAYIAALYDAYYAEAKTMGILDQDEEVPYTEFATRENIARWLVNAGKMPETFATEKLKTAGDWTDIQPRNVKSVEKLLDYGIMDITASNQFNSKSAMTRIGFANMISKVYTNFANDFGLADDHGIIIGISNQKNDQGVSVINYRIRKSDNTLATINVVESNTKDTSGLVVYKDPNLGTHRTLALGDELKFTLSGDVIKYVEVLKDYTVTRKLIETFDSMEGVNVLQGVVVSNLNETDKASAKDLVNQRIRVELDDDAMIDLVSIFDRSNNTQNTYPVASGQLFMAPSAIKTGDKITIYVQGDNVLYVSMGTVPVNLIKGSLRDVDALSQPAKVSVLGFDNRIYTYPVDPHATIMINDYVGSIQDLKVGAAVTMRVLNDKVITLSASSYQPSTGYIPQNGKIEFGTIRTISGNTFTMLGYDQNFKISDSTQVYRGATPISADKLVAGDRLKLYFDEINSVTPSKIEAEGKEQLVKFLLKGKLFNYNQHTDQVEITNRYKFANAQWQSEKAPYTATYKLAKDVTLYDGNTPVSLTELNNDYFKKDAYMVIRDNYGRKEIGKIVFKDGTERHYNDVIGNYDTVLNAFELGNNVNIGYDDATIFVQDNRVVDGSVLRNNASVYVLSNQNRRVNSAQIVSVLPNLNPIFGGLYVGSLETVDPYNLSISNYSSVKNYQFKEVKLGEKKLYLNDDTKIYDFNKNAYITRETLFNDAYTPEENTPSKKGRKGLKHKHYYGVYVTDGQGNIIAMTLRFKELVKNNNIDDSVYKQSGIRDSIKDILDDTRFTTGTIVSFNDEWKRLEINNAQNYALYSDSWQISTTNLYIEIGDAIIMKNNKVIAYRDLHVGDKVTAIRYDEDALVLYVD